MGTEIWRADDSPHVVTYDVNVRNGATLIIEPCAEVQLAADRVINVDTGTLRAEGTPDKPIRFSGQAGARWGHVFVKVPGEVHLAYASFSGGGSDDLRSNATLVASGDGTKTAGILHVDHVTISGSLGAGVLLRYNAAFAAGSTQLTVVGSGNDKHPFPLEIGEYAFTTLPDGSYTGNRIDEILVKPEGISQSPGLQVDATIRNLGVPYRIGRSSARSESLRVGGGNVPATLTIEPGVVLKFHPGLALEVEHFTGSFPATGVIRAVGTPTQPIVFTSAAQQPAAGDWMGLWFGGKALATNLLQNVRIEYAGGECLCILNTCPEGVASEGAIILTEEPFGSFLSDSTIAHSAGHGVTLGYRGAFVDFMAGNTFENVAGCKQTYPQDTSGGKCPSTCP